MVQQALTTFVPKPGDHTIVVVRVPNYPIRSRWHAQKVINATRAKLPLDLMEREVVVVVGEPDGPKVALGSSPQAEAFIMAVAADLPTYDWQAKEIDP